MKKRVISVICMVSILLTTLAPVLPVAAAKSDPIIIEESDIPLRLHYDKEAPYGNEGTEDIDGIDANDGWERWSLPLGNGFFGANVFGRTETERIQLTEKTLSNPYYKTNPNTGSAVSLGGVNNFSETYIDIGHPFAEVTDYSRWLDLKTAISGVSYSYEGVTYTREVFTSYPDKALVIRLDASEAGKLDFVLRPTIPWKQEYAAWEGDGASKTGQVISYLDGGDGIVELSGKLGYYDVDFLGMYRVVTNGGTVSATTCTNEYNETDGTITVSGATSAYIYVNLGTDYVLSSEMFLASDKEKPTFDTTLEHTRVKVGGEFNAIAAQLAGKSFEDAYAVLKNNHLADYTELFGRVSLDIGDREDAELTTDALLEKYKSGEYSNYLDALYFQYGRYLLIASSRPGTLVANLQGTWSRYNKAPWGSGIWHNINVQMNYWPAFSTNIAETFEAYVAYNAAYMAAAEKFATDNVNRYSKDQLGADGGNGWCIGTGAFPYQIEGSRSAGNLGFTTQLFWEYYEYTKDKELLEEVVFPILVSAARYIVKTVELTEDGKYVVSYCDSPEVHVNGVWYYTKGTTYAQTFAYQNNYNALLAAKELGIDLTDSALLETEELSVFKRLMEQLDKYDPIIVGLSGQVKEFREEDYYSSVGDDPHHRHISQLVGLYPGNIINSNTPAWLDAAKYTLTERGDNATGWGIAHRLNLWARTKDGDRTYKVLNTLLTTSTATNLWDLHPPFQIDGNLGGTAGISEMLLQSHEGYIAPLAAIPSAWASGSYTGLVARGNFEVSALWEDGIAKAFNIKSLSGNTASVSYGGITSASVVRASDGRAVDYTVSGTDLITFETEVGETYVITGFKLSEKLPAPATLTVDRAGLGEINLTWDAVDGAVAYRVYTATESQPDYTLVETTTATRTVYIPKAGNINARMTFKVVPVNADGVEGRGALAYQNPIEVDATLAEYEAYAFENGELQVTLKTTENTQKYKLWKMAQGESEYTLVTESIYPIIIYNGYAETDKYAVSLVSDALRTESELYELTEIRNATEGSDSSAAVWHTNLLSEKQFAQGSEATTIFGGAYGYQTLTDGVYDKGADGKTDIHLGRFSTKDGATACLDGTVTLGGLCLLDELRLYDFTTSKTATRLGDTITVYALVDGEWKTVALIEGRDNVIAAKTLDSDKGLHYVSIDVSGTIASAVRVVCKNSDGTTEGITMYEITLSGAALNGGGAGSASIDNVLSGKLFTGDKSPINSTYGYQTLTDGDYGVHTGRFAMSDKAYSQVTMECDLEDLYLLYDLMIFDHADSGVTRSKETTVEVYYCGAWTTLVSAQPLASGNDRLTGQGHGYTLFALNGVKAEKIRITFYNNSGEAKGISLYEIKCSASKASENSDWNVIADSESATVNTTVNGSILSGKEFVPNGDAGSYVFNATYGYPKINDGIYNPVVDGKPNIHLGRFSTKEVEGAYVDGTVNLGGKYNLGEMRIYDFDSGTSTRLGDSITVYLYTGTEWITAYTIEGKDIASSRKTDKSLNLKYLPIDLTGYTAEQIRVHLSNSTASGITFYEITCAGTNLSGETVKEFVSTPLTDAEISNLTDGKTDTSITVTTDESAHYYYEFDLGGVFGLYTLNIRDVREATDLVGGVLATRSNDTYVELYINGKWVRIVDGASLSVTEEYTTFDLYGLKASKIRIGFKNTQVFDNGTTPVVVISEITCSASSAAADKKPLLNAYASLPIIANGDDTYLANMKKFKSYMTEFMLSDSDVEAYASEISAYAATLLDGEHTEHSIKQFEGKEPTCAENGWFAYEKCENCDYTTYESILRTGHTDESKWESDGTSHWKTCLNDGCEEKFELSEHSFDNDHDTTCDVCGYTRTITHTYTVTDYDGTYHWKKCTGCDAIDESTKAEHVYADAADTTCDCGYNRNHVHVFDRVKYDDNNHWNECFCGAAQEGSVAPHEFDNACDTTCACGYVRTITHDYTVNNNDNTHHWVECSVCGAVDEETRQEHNGGTATCVDKAVCADCSVEYGELDADNHDTEGVTGWTKDSISHWQVCNCGERINQTNHYSDTWVSENNVHYKECDVCDRTFNDGVCHGGTATCEEPAVCEVCNNSYGGLADHVYGTEWVSNDTHHWHECTCGEKDDEIAHIFGEAIDGFRSCECGFTVEVEEAPDEDTSFFGRIFAAIAEWFASIGNWFKRLFGIIPA